MTKVPPVCRSPAVRKSVVVVVVPPEEVVLVMKGLSPVPEPDYWLAKPENSMPN